MLSQQLTYFRYSENPDASGAEIRRWHGNEKEDAVVGNGGFRGERGVEPGGDFFGDRG